MKGPYIMKKLTVIFLAVLILAGMCIPVSAATNVNFKIGSFLYEKDGFIYGIPKETSCETVASNFEGENVVKDSSGADLDLSALVGTGAKIKAGREAEVVIIGDINGDGKLTSVDYLRIKQYVSGKFELEGAYFTAADINADGSIKSIDYLSVKQCFSGKKDLYTGMTAEPYTSDLPVTTFDASQQRLSRDKITIGVFRFDGELWDDEHMSEFKNEWGGDYLMSYSSHDTGRKVKTLYSLCDKYGVGIFGRSLPRYTYPNPGKPNPVDDDPDYVEFDKKLEEYKYDNESVWADDVYDEPRSTAFDWISGAIDRYVTKFPAPAKTFFYTNLNPMNQQVGNLEGHGSATYTDYIKDFVNKVDTDYISFDIYPFDNNMTGMSTNYIYNLDVVASAARESKRNFWIIIQAGQNPVPEGMTQLMPKKSQIRYQAYTSLAFGAKSIIYACYSPCWWADGTSMINQDGTKNEYWYVGQQLNKEMKFLSPTFCQYDNVDVFALNITNSVTGRQMRMQNKRAKQRGYGESRGFENFAAESDILIGAFEKKDGNGYAVMLVDNTDPYNEEATNTVTFTTKIEGTVKCIQGAAETVLTPDANGVYTVNLTSGDGAFVTVS